MYGSKEAYIDLHNSIKLSKGTNFENISKPLNKSA